MFLIFSIPLKLCKRVASLYFFCIYPPPELLPVLELLELYMMPTLKAALLYSSRAGSDMGPTLDRFEELCQLGFLIPNYCTNSLRSCKLHKINEAFTIIIISCKSKACIINS